MFSINEFLTGVKFKVRGDGSEWEALSNDGEGVIQGKNLSTGHVGPIPLGNVIEVLNVAKAEIPSEDIRLSDVPIVPIAQGDKAFLKEYRKRKVKRKKRGSDD